jgi:hypothetical protein
VKRGSGSGRDAAAAFVNRGACIPLWGRTFLRKALLRPHGRTSKRRARAPAKRDRQRRGCHDRAVKLLHPRKNFTPGRAPEWGTRGPAKRGAGSGGKSRPRLSTRALASRFGVTPSFGRHCSAHPVGAPGVWGDGSRKAGSHNVGGCHHRIVELRHLKPLTPTWHRPSELRLAVI